jgi:hypothetical protein
MSDSVGYIPPDLSGYMTVASANQTIADMNARISADDAAIAALQASVGAMRGLQFIGNVVVTDTALVSLALGMKRKDLPLTGVVATDKLFFTPNGVPTTGCEPVNVYASAANTVTVSYFTPALGIGATFSIPVSVYRVTT